MTHAYTPEQISALADAVWQALDDMGKSGQSCCLATKAQLRIAIEPFVDDDTPTIDYSLVDAQEIASEAGL